MDEATIRELAITAAEPVFVTNHLNRVISVNRAAADLLGFDGAEATRLPCWRLLGGTDVGGNRFCRPNCPLLRAALRGETLPRFSAMFQTVRGTTVCVSVSALVLYRTASPRNLAIVHLLVPCRWSGDSVDTADVFAAAVAATQPPATMNRCMLTCRELEILHLMDEGVRSDQIARRLFISVLTVRTHIQRILSKLNAHSKLKAIAVARRLHLV
jgi:DNA-binding CsgD family transcriptional regulator